ncbi:hypothetical protein N7471_012435 [Penicillium samsonianum]|uniref:uncharacterized protein n=1 Tax=Penicillium samsonianum TaxID=1882272 RepID=UPI0025497AB5|nr:uncharacterized protein N7471_012435 [Penicillium samsonianum]KAJ6125118.1 hypothetical protein N7471_012435 [Penicillium samsonianum]
MCAIFALSAAAYLSPKLQLSTDSGAATIPRETDCPCAIDLRENYVIGVVAAVALDAVTALFMISVSYTQHYRSPRPSTLLLLFLSLSLPLNAIRARTIWAVQTRSFCAVFIANLGFDLIKLLLESIEQRPSLTDQATKWPRETIANVFNRSMFWWLNPLLIQGFKDVLDADQLLSIDARVNDAEGGDRFMQKWDAVQPKSSSALTMLLMVHHRWAIASAILPRLCLTGFTFAQPFLLTRVVSFVSEANAPLSQNYGYGLIVATMIIYLGLAITTAGSQHKTFRLITMIRGSLVPLVYRHTMRLDVGIARDSAALTLMSVDIERISSGLQHVHEVWASPIDIGLALWLLERQLGLAVVAFAAIFVVCTLLGLGVASTMGERQQRWLQAIQNRVQATSEMLKNMKEVRLGGLQELMADKLRGLRAKEVSESTPFKRALTLIVTFSYTTTSAGPLLAFTMYSLLAKRNGFPMLNYDKAYTALSLFALLQSPMALILDAIAGLVTALGAVARIGEYLSKPTGTSGESSRLSPPLALPCELLDEKTRPTMVTVQGFSAGWDSERPMILKDLSFEVRSSSINFVVGPVACGKTTLLLAILGEVSRHDGRLEVSVPRIGYCSQTPWITNATIRRNILGTSVYNQPWYDKVVEMCLIQDDIAGFPHGDQEWVGNSGMTLSGGQRARLAIARAVYAREKLLLLDDVFSGLDGKTEEHLFHNLFGPDGLLKEAETTVILATHAVQRLAYADQIIILDSEGRIADEGSSNEVIASAKEMVFSSSKKDQSAGPSIDTGLDISRVLSLEEAPTGEDRRTGDTAVYKYYIQTVHPFSASIFFAACTLFVVGLTIPQFMVKWWLERDDEYTVTHMGEYLGAYAGLSALAILSLPVAVWHLTERMLPRASMRFHASLLITVLQAPLQFFSTTDVGTTLNRFAQDLQLSDMELPLALFNTSVELLLCTARLIIIAITSKWIGIALPALLAVFYMIQKFYLRTARQLRLLDIEAKAPLFSTFLELISGLTTIRAFGWQSDFDHRNREVFDRSQKPFYLLYCVQRWLNLVLDLVVAAVAIMVVAIGVRTQGQVDAGFMGIALVNIVQLSISIKAFLSNWTKLEISIGAVSRIRAFALDAPLSDTDSTESVLPTGWPEKGRIEFQNVTAQYEGSPHPVIRNLTLSIAPGEKIALCGATGSGKSSLATSLFRLLTPSEGMITIDDVDVSTVARDTLYNRLICVTQSPHLIAGSIRENVDPFGATTDDQVIELALKEVHLWDTVASRGGIHAQLSEGLFSVGQQQLLCLARAMIRPGSVVVLDEVTASVDRETDRAMQEIIRHHFASRTVITIAHRISTILDADRVAVVSDGAIVELGPPGELLARVPPSRFRGLYEATAVSNQSSETLQEIS